MIAVGDKRAIAVRGDYRPVEVCVGGNRVAGWQEQTVEGVTQAEFEDTYNDRAVLTVQGAKLEQVSTTGKNLFDIAKVESNTRVTNNGDGTITINTNSTSTGSSAGGEALLADYAPGLVVGQTYTLTALTTGTSKHIYLQAASYIWKFGAAVTITDSMLQSRVIWYASGTSTTAVISNVQIELGDTATDYEPYSGGYASPSPDWPQPIHGTEAVVTVSNADTDAVQTTLPVLYGRDGVCDVLETDVVVDGVHRSRVTRRWKTIVLTGRETVTKSAESIGKVWLYYTARADLYKSGVSVAHAYTTHFAGNIKLWSASGIGVLTNTQSLIFGWYENNTADDFCAYLAAQYAAGTPVTVVYRLDEPAIELGDPIDIRTLPRSTIIGCTDPAVITCKVIDRTI